MPDDQTEQSHRKEQPLPDARPDTAHQDRALRKLALGWGLALLLICVLPWAVLEDGLVLYSWNVFGRRGEAGGHGLVIPAYFAVAGLSSVGLGLAAGMPSILRSFSLFSIGLVPLVYNLAGMTGGLAAHVLSVYFLLFALSFRHGRNGPRAGRGAVAVGAVLALLFFALWHGFRLSSPGARSVGDFLGVTLSPAGTNVLTTYEWMPLLLVCCAFAGLTSGKDEGTPGSLYPLSRVSFWGLLYYVAGYRLVQGIVALAEAPSAALRVLPTLLYPAVYLGAFYSFFILGGGRALSLVMDRLGYGKRHSDPAATDPYLPP